MGYNQRRQHIPSRFQRDQLQLVQPELQRVNAIAASHLLRVLRLCNDEKQLVHACANLAEITKRGKYLMVWCESIMQSDLGQSPEPVQVLVGAQCDACCDRQYSRPRNNKRRVRKEGSWHSQVDFYLWLTTGVAAFAVSPAASTLHCFQKLLPILSSFRQLLTRQYLFLKRITPDCAGAAEVIMHPAARCMTCGAEMPKTLPADTNVAMGSSYPERVGEAVDG